MRNETRQMVNKILWGRGLPFLSEATRVDKGILTVAYSGFGLTAIFVLLFVGTRGNTFYGYIAYGLFHLALLAVVVECIKCVWDTIRQFARRRKR